MGKKPRMSALAVTVTVICVVPGTPPARLVGVVTTVET